MQDEHENCGPASPIRSFLPSSRFVLNDLLPCAAGCCRGCGKVGIPTLDFHFSIAHASSLSPRFVRSMETQPELWKCGNLAAFARFPRSAGKGGNPVFGFPGFPPLRHFHCSLSLPAWSPPSPLGEARRERVFHLALPP